MVMPRRISAETFAAAGAETEEGRRPTLVSAPAAVSPELGDRPRRRTFTAADKLRILGEIDRGGARGDRRHPAPRGAVFVAPDRLAPATRRRRLRSAGAGPAGCQAGGGLIESTDSG